MRGLERPAWSVWIFASICVCSCGAGQGFADDADLVSRQPCTIIVTPQESTFDETGGSGSFTVTASTPDCGWGTTAYLPWITITSPPGGVGNGSVSFDVAPGDSFRQSIVNVGYKAFHVVTQNGPPLTCWTRQITNTSFGVDHASLGIISDDAQWITYTLIPGPVVLEHLVTSSQHIISDEPCYAGNPFVNRDGRLVAYESACDPLGSNLDRNREIMLYNRTTGEKVQLTDSIGYGNFSPRLSRSGDRVVFVSMNDYTGANPASVQQLFVVFVSNGRIIQMTSFQDHARPWFVSADGDFVVFSSEEDLAGLNPDLNEEIFLVEIPSSSLQQITNTTSGRNSAVAVSCDGTRIAFSTTSTELIGASGLVMLDRVTGELVNVPTPLGASDSTSLDAAGSRIGSRGGSIVSIHDLDTSRSQILTTNGLNSGSVQTNGETMSISSTADLTGENPDGSIELFVAICPAPLFADGFEFAGTHRWSTTVE